MEQVSSTPQANFNEAKPGGSYKITFRKIARAAAAEVRVHKKIAIISYVLFGVSMLLCMFNSHFYYSYNADGTALGAEFTPSVWGIVFGVMGVIVGYFAALNVFRDVNNQQLCDVTMALPIKAVERYLSKMLALFYLQLAPLITAMLFGNGIAVLVAKIYYGLLAPESWQGLIMLVVGSISCSLFIMACAVLCTCCCGAPAESAYFSLILMFVINALPITYVNSIISQCSGFDSRIFYGAEGGIDVLFWGFLPIFSGGAYDFSVGGFVLHNIISIVISLCVLGASIFIYKKRDARTVGTPVASRIFFEVMMALGCFTLFSFFAFTEAAWWGLLVTGIIYLIINVIVSRAKINIMSFFTWLVKYTVTTVAFVALMMVTIKTGGLGQIYSRPAAKYLEGAQFSITSYDNSSSTRREITTEALTAEQADEVMSIVKKHMIKGYGDRSAVSILTDSSEYRARSSVYVRARSDKEYTTRPTSMRHFYRNTIYVRNSDISYVVYGLDFSQHLTITAEEARAMCDELVKLDYVYSETYRNGRVISTEHGGEIFIPEEEYAPDFDPDLDVMMTEDGRYVNYY